MAGRTDGFTLVEVLVALAILTGIFAAVSTGVSGAVRGIRHARLELIAVRLAQAKLAAAGIEFPLADGETTAGEADGLSWRVKTQLYRPADSALPSVPGLTAYRVSVEVTWQSSPLERLRSLTLDGLKLGTSL